MTPVFIRFDVYDVIAIWIEGMKTYTQVPNTAS